MDRLLMRFAAAMGIVLVTAILITGAAAFLCAALYLALASAMSPAAAAALTGLGALAAMACVLLAGRLILARPERPLAAEDAPAEREDPQLAQALAALLGEEIVRALHDHPKGATAFALAAGVAAGASPGLRNLLTGLIGLR